MSTSTNKKVARNAKKNAPRAENVVYIGPNRLADGLKKFTVYRRRPNGIIEQASQKYEHISRLFVSVDDLNQAMADVAKKGTPRNLAYAEAEREG